MSGSVTFMTHTLEAWPALTQRPRRSSSNVWKAAIHSLRTVGRDGPEMRTRMMC
ncbi:hypothetical protein FOTG_19125 [Fusarium oxysporum f. sp. vasinfectum 25433]|uniref:Uncharacterized protein n=1 Tax=Fusarium oxysporum f. sp. vasinfectum 25433 TaxID=1089449 RepID=X0KFL9_FUSOX|nr:hypothetical protein FOTG_19125 [Fusarium oxysporum f. sp. vasinfectum 25433]